jgi:hypothetical protein
MVQVEVGESLALADAVMKQLKKLGVRLDDQERTWWVIDDRHSEELPNTRRTLLNLIQLGNIRNLIL